MGPLCVWECEYESVHIHICGYIYMYINGIIGLEDSFKYYYWMISLDVEELSHM